MILSHHDHTSSRSLDPNREQKVVRNAAREAHNYASLLEGLRIFLSRQISDLIKTECTKPPAFRVIVVFPLDHLASVSGGESPFEA
jgi:hypothetical protein